MSLSHALLTSLVEKSSSGYELARRFDKSIGFFWHATHQQIYRELARMESAGWIEGYSPADAGQSRKREFRVLAPGRRELTRWSQEPSPTLHPHDALTVKLRASAVLGEGDLSGEMQRQLQEHQDRLALYRSIEARDFPPRKRLNRKDAIQRSILARGIRYEEAEVAWAQDLLEVLSRKRR